MIRSCCLRFKGGSCCLHHPFCSGLNQSQRRINVSRLRFVPRLGSLRQLWQQRWQQWPGWHFQTWNFSVPPFKFLWFEAFQCINQEISGFSLAFSTWFCARNQLRGGSPLPECGQVMAKSCTEPVPMPMFRRTIRDAQLEIKSCHRKRSFWVFRCLFESTWIHYFSCLLMFVGYPRFAMPWSLYSFFGYGCTRTAVIQTDPGTVEWIGQSNMGHRGRIRTHFLSHNHICRYIGHHLVDLSGLT